PARGSGRDPARDYFLSGGIVAITRLMPFSYLRTYQFCTGLWVVGSSRKVPRGLARSPTRAAARSMSCMASQLCSATADGFRPVLAFQVATNAAFSGVVSAGE